MRYRGVLVVPAGTTQAIPAESVVGLVYGVITEVEILFPAGHAGLVHLQVCHGEQQVLPTTPGASFVGDDHLITMNEQYVLEEKPFSLTLRGWAPLATLNHTVYVDVSLVSVARATVDLFVPGMLPEGMEV